MTKKQSASVGNASLSRKKSDSNGFSFRNALMLIIMISCVAFALSEFYQHTQKPNRLPRRRFETTPFTEKGNSKSPLVVLYHGKPEEAPYEWNTGVWPAWGRHKGDMYKRNIPQRLDWQAEGAVIKKGCDVHCHISHDQSLVAGADAVVMEAINHLQFYGDDTTLPFPWPQKENTNQIWGIFHYESSEKYKGITQNQEILDQFDFSVIPSPSADVPITIVCDWGYPLKKFVDIPPFVQKEGTSASIVDFRGVVPPGYSRYFDTLHSLVTIDSFAGKYKNKEIPEGYTLANRIKHMEEYTFVIIAESVIANDWICPEYSQALLSGAIPIYIGAPNIADYYPADNSIIHVRDYVEPEQLVKRIQAIIYDENEFDKQHAWKTGGLTTTFHQHLDNCVHQAECRICKHVIEHMVKSQ